MVRDNTALQIYEDGILVTTKTVAAGNVTFGNLFFGARNGSGERFDGQIDEYGYWFSALSGDNIAWLAQNSINPASITPPPAPEPASLGTWLLLGLLGLRWRPRRRKLSGPSTAGQ
jgi:hypothetical protein